MTSVERAVSGGAVGSRGWANVLDPILEAARRYGERPALTFMTSAEPGARVERMTFAEFGRLTRAAALLFRELGADERSSVALLSPNVPYAQIALWGAEAASRSCPINFLLSAEHIAELLRASNARVLVAYATSPELDLWPKVAAIRALAPAVRHVLAIGGPADGAEPFEELLETVGGEFAPVGRLDDVAAFFHTGGTTGAPKLAQHTHRNQLHNAWSCAHVLGIGPEDVLVNGLPLFHVGGSLCVSLACIVAGAEQVLPTSLGARNRAVVERIWGILAERGVTMLVGVPTTLAALTAIPVDVALPALRSVATGGSALAGGVADALDRMLGLPIRIIYGMTECAGAMALTPHDGPATRGSAGLPIPESEARVVSDPARIAETTLASGDTGVIVTRGPHVGPGYLDPSRNDGVFSRDGWLITGDLGHIAENGELFITGRAKDIIIRGGHNIDPGLIEEAALTHAAVENAAAVGAPDPIAGELPVLYVTLHPGRDADADSLLAHVRARISEPPAVPRFVEILDAMPLTGVGKIYKPALRGRSVRRVIEGCVATADVPSRPAIDVRDSDGRSIVVFTFSAATDAATAAAAASRVMAPFTLLQHAVEFEQHPVKFEAKAGLVP